MKMIGVLLSVCVSLPLYFYLLYKILVHIDATELMWFLFYAYIPVNVVSSLLYRLYDDEVKK